MHDINPDNWKEFYGAVSGAASALAGLVFVALSINLDRILAVPGLSGRGGETIVLLAASLLISLIMLIPGQSSTALGAEVGIMAIAAWGLPTALQLDAGRAKHYARRWQFILRVTLHQLATLPLLLAAGALLIGATYADYVLALGVVLVLAVALYEAWILLVEIMR